MSDPKQRPAEETCEHEWRQDDDLGFTQECCDKCGRIEPLCEGCGAVKPECCCGPAPACQPIPQTTREFPADLPGWFFRSSRLCLVIVRCTAARDGDFIMLESHEWIRVSDLRTCQRSSSLEGPWQDYVGGEWKVVASG